MNDHAEAIFTPEGGRQSVSSERSSASPPACLAPNGIDPDTLFSVAPWPAWILEAETFAFLAVNRAATLQYGYSSDEFARMTIQDICLPEDFPLFLQQVANLPVAFGWKSVLRHYRKDGSILFVEPARQETTYQGRRAIFSILNDVTERVRVEQAYKDSEEQNRLLLVQHEQEAAARQFLTEASIVLASSLDYTKTLQRVADLAVPHIADWCGVDILEADGSIHQVAVAHVDPEKLKWAYEIRKRYPPDPKGPDGLARVLREGQSAINPDLSQDVLALNAQDEQHLEMIRRINPRSAMIVPMAARGRILGAVTFIATHESGKRYTPEDLMLAEGLAARAALAIDNARLYGAAQEEIEVRRRTEEALRTSEERFRFALSHSDIAVYMQDRDLRYTWVYNGAGSGEMPALYGKTDADFLVEEDAGRLTEIKRRVLQTGVEERHAVRATYKEQAVRFFDTLFAPLRDAEGNIQGITGTVHDITERKKAQDTLAKHQAEIEALNARLQRSMRETHHRVKNNLQVILTLINLQQAQHGDLVPVGELQRLTQHIRALAEIHDLLTYQAQSDPQVSDVALEILMDRLFPTLQMMAQGREIQLYRDNLRVPISQATSLAVLVNELISNSLKHGDGAITIRIRVTGSLALLEVSDKGDGFPEGFDPMQAANTGLDLIQSLAQWDLGGSVRFENGETGGARVVVEFPVPASSSAMI